MTERLPNTDEDNWADIMGANDGTGGFLRVAHNDDGTPLWPGSSYLLYADAVGPGAIASGGSGTYSWSGGTLLGSDLEIDSGDATRINILTSGWYHLWMADGGFNFAFNSDSSFPAQENVSILLNGATYLFFYENNSGPNPAVGGGTQVYVPGQAGPFPATAGDYIQFTAQAFTDDGVDWQFNNNPDCLTVVRLA